MEGDTLISTFILPSSKSSAPLLFLPVLTMDRWWVCSKYTVGALALHLPVNISRAWCNSGVLHCPDSLLGDGAVWGNLHPLLILTQVHLHLSTTLLLLKQLHVTRSLSATSFVTCEPLEMPTSQSSFSLPFYSFISSYANFIVCDMLV